MWDVGGWSGMWGEGGGMGCGRKGVEWDVGERGWSGMWGEGGGVGCGRKGVEWDRIGVVC